MVLPKANARVVNSKKGSYPSFQNHNSPSRSGELTSSRMATEALLALYRYHLTDDEKQWIARQLNTDMADLRKSE